MIHVIANPASHSGKGLNIWMRAEKELQKMGAEYTVHLTEYVGHSIEITKQICANEKRPFTLIVVGGDGSVNEIMSSIDDFAGINFAVIPSGSGNDLARGLNLPKSPEELIRHIVNESSRFKMDYGVATLEDGTKRKFSVSAGINFDAAICEENLDSPIKKKLNKIHLGALSYLFIGIKMLRACKQIDMDVVIDGKEKRHYDKVFFLAAMNQKYEGGGLAVVPTANCADGKLSVGVIYGMSKFSAFCMIPFMTMGGKHVLFKGVDTFECEKVEIVAKEPCCIHTDGEIMGHFDKVEFSCPKDKVTMLL
jgi:YegS/Rv2252/BmrU family lipid kinase